MRFAIRSLLLLPVFALFFAVAMLASVGLPGTSGFIGEFLIILGAVKFNVTIAVLAGTTLIVGVCYMLWMFQRVFFEKGNPKTETFQDLTLIETLTILPIIILIIFMGIFPQPFIQKITPAAERQIAQHAAPASTVMQLADNSVSVITYKQEKD